jgi:hypothetical protein
MKGQTTVKDKEGNKLRVSINDPRYLSGELVGMHKGTVSVKDKEGNKLRVSMNDPRYLSGELNGTTFGVPPRNKGTVCYTNGTKNIYIGKQDDVPDGFYAGSIRKGRKMRVNIQCPHCNKMGANPSNMKRWHFDNCKILSNN